MKECGKIVYTFMCSNPVVVVAQYPENTVSMSQSP